MPRTPSKYSQPSAGTAGTDMPITRVELDAANTWADAGCHSRKSGTGTGTGAGTAYASTKGEIPFKVMNNSVYDSK